MAATHPCLRLARLLSSRRVNRPKARPREKMRSPDVSMLLLFFLRKSKVLQVLDALPQIEVAVGFQKRLSANVRSLR